MSAHQIETEALFLFCFVFMGFKFISADPCQGSGCARSLKQPSLLVETTCVFCLCQCRRPWGSGRPFSSNPCDNKKKGRCPSRNCQGCGGPGQMLVKALSGADVTIDPTVLILNCLPGGFLVNYFLPLQLDSCLHWERQNHVPQLGGASSPPFGCKCLWHHLQSRNE